MKKDRQMMKRVGEKEEAYFESSTMTMTRKMNPGGFYVASLKPTGGLYWSTDRASISFVYLFSSLHPVRLQASLWALRLSQSTTDLDLSLKEQEGRLCPSPRWLRLKMGPQLSW
jgi:hypothetical protein